MGQLVISSWIFLLLLHHKFNNTSIRYVALTAMLLERSKRNFVFSPPVPKEAAAASGGVAVDNESRPVDLSVIRQ